MLQIVVLLACYYGFGYLSVNALLSWWSSPHCVQLYNNIYYVYSLDTTFFCNIKESCV